MSDASEVITRFAPSPTGHLHIGGARTALFNWALARRLGGRMLVRIEDTDRARSNPEEYLQILRSLAWLGIEWDEGPELKAAQEAESLPAAPSQREEGTEKTPPPNPLPRGGGTEKTPPPGPLPVGGGSQRLGGDPRGVGPFFQSQRIALYETHLTTLLEQGRAYHAFETAEELEAKRKEAIQAKRAYRYDRAGLDVPEEERRRRAEAGEPHVVRFRAPDSDVAVKDEILGEVRIAAGELDDFVIRKADGHPTYHFAVVVDDELMGVTHVVRGQEHLINTPRHVALQQALGFRTPVYGHLPLIMNVDGSKMSKRDKDKAVRQACRDAGLESPPVEGVDRDDFAAWLKDKQRQLPTEQLVRMAEALGATLPPIDVQDFRAAGYLPETLTNYIALLGWSPGEDLEKFDMGFLAERFDLSRVGKTAAKFDYKKLLAFNGDRLSEMSDEAFRRRWWAWCREYEPGLLEALGAAEAPNERFDMLADATRPRCKSFRDAADGAAFLRTGDDDVEFDEKAVAKNLHKNDGEGLDSLRDVRDRLASVETWAPAPLHGVIEAASSEREVGMGKIAQPLRVALTGSTVSPPIDATLATLGRDSALKRIDRCLDECAP